MAGETEPSRTAAVLAAFNPKTTAAELEALALQRDPAARAGVAAHPNTPAPVLAQLARDYPAEVLSNPALLLLRLAHPRMLQSWPHDSLLALIRQPSAPDWVRQHALRSGNTELLVALASHPTLTPEEFTQLSTHPAWLVRARIAARHDLTPDTLHHFAQDPDYGVRLALASRADLPAQSVELLRGDPSRFVRQVLEQTHAAIPTHTGPTHPK